MAQWLKLELAKAFGIAANIDFPLPASFIWEMFTGCWRTYRARALQQGAMSWHLMTILPTLLGSPAFAPLAAYLGAVTGGIRSRCGSGSSARRWRICSTSIWSTGRTGSPAGKRGRIEPGAGRGERSGLAAEPGASWWPAPLALSPSGYHCANLYEAFIHELERTADLPGRLPQRVFVFGISAPAASLCGGLLALGSRPEVEVHLFVTNPCRYYWGSARSQDTGAPRKQAQTRHGSETCRALPTPLLASMGKLGRDYLHQLMELEVLQIEAFVDIDEVDDDEGKVTLLRPSRKMCWSWRNGGRRVQFDASHHKSPVSLDDGTLQITPATARCGSSRCCTTGCWPVRQDHLTPKDVVVMMPDVNSYGPYIPGRFWQEGGRGARARSLGDLRIGRRARGGPLLQSFLRPAQAAQRPLRGGELLAILEVPAVLRRFELDDDEFNQLRVWVWRPASAGADDDYPSASRCRVCPATAGCSACKGACCSVCHGDGEPVVILPYADIEGQQGLILGKLALVRRFAGGVLPRLQQAQPLAEWHACLLALLERFYLADEDEERQLQLIRSQLTDWQAQLGEARFEQAISADLLQDYLGSVLGSPAQPALPRRSGQLLHPDADALHPLPPGLPARHERRRLPAHPAPMGFDLMAVASPARGPIPPG